MVEICPEGEKYFKAGDFEIDGIGTNEGTENKNGPAKSVNILISFKFFTAILIVS